MFSLVKFRHKYDYNECAEWFYSFSKRKQFENMFSDSDILDELDNILANEESDDEFLDYLCFDDDDSATLVSPPLSRHNREEQIQSYDDNIEQDLPGTSETYLDVPVAQNITGVTGVFEKNIRKKPVNKSLHTPDFKWKSTGKFSPKTNSFNSSKCGVQKHEFGLSDDSLIIDFFEAFMSEFILGKVAFETNRYAEQYLKQEDIAPKSSVKYWKPTNIGELYVFLATSMLMARNKKLEINEYWSTDPLLMSPIFSKILSRDRYLLILRMLHFCNNENQKSGDRLFKLDVVLDEIRANFKAGMVPFQNLVIDESLVLWKGRLSFKQFIKSKRHRFGVKLFVLCDVETDFILDIIIYTGAETCLLQCDKNIGISGAVVMTLMAPYLKKGHNLYTDNWYTSPILCQHLYKKKTTLTGTVRKNRRGMPDLKKKLKLGEVQSSHTQTMMALKWLDRREVYMLSSLYDSSSASTNKIDRASGKVVKKPTCIVNYNACMGNIDKCDMLLSSIECVRKTMKWYKKIFFHLVDLCLLNSFSAYKTVSGKNIPIANFQLELIRQLLDKYGKYNNSPNRGRASTKDEPTRLTARHFPTDVPKNEVGKANRRKCIVCSKNNKRKDTLYMCDLCNVGLCVTPCFGIYHTKANYKATQLLY